MGQLRSIKVTLPGAYGINSQDEVTTDQEQTRFCTLDENAVVDTTGKPGPRQNFQITTVAGSNLIEVIHANRNQDASETIFSAGGGKIFTGTTTLSTVANYTAGFQFVDMTKTYTSNGVSSGLPNTASNFTAVVVINGTTNAVSVVGTAAQTAGNLITQINTDLSGATAALVDGNIKITSATSGTNSSTISITDPGGANGLFSAATNYVAVRAANVGQSGAVGNNNWQFATLNQNTFAAQYGKPFLTYSSGEKQITGQPWTKEPNCVIAAYGRLWAADDQTGGNRYTLWWSNLLAGTQWNTGDAGQLDLTNAWPEGQDDIIAVVGAFGRLIVFGRKAILLYTLPADNDPASMTLTDTVTNFGCLARDSVLVTDDGIYFLSDNGLYRINRLAQVTSLITSPLMSRLFNDDLLADVAAETATLIRAGYYPKEGWYVLSFPTSNRTYCLHTRRLIPDLDVPMTTVWTNTARPFRDFAISKTGAWYTGATNGLYAYGGYTNTGNGVYTFDFYTQWNDFGGEDKEKHLKDFVIAMTGTTGQTGTFKWQTDYNTATTFSETFTFVPDTSPGPGTVLGNLTESCAVVRFGCSMPVSAAFNIQSIQIFATGSAVKP